MIADTFSLRVIHIFDFIPKITLSYALTLIVNVNKKNKLFEWRGNSFIHFLVLLCVKDKIASVCRLCVCIFCILLKVPTQI